jgi:CO dehydrogenase nickel-insertion accessory protein CooC1
LQEKINQVGIPLLGSIPADDDLSALEFSGKPLISLNESSPVYQAVARMLGKIT